MKKRINPFRPVYPSPAALIVSADASGRPNVLTLAEVFNVSIREPVIVGIAVRQATYSHGLIVAGGQFTVNLPTVSLLEKVDTAGLISGRDVPDKLARIGLRPLPSSVVVPPILAECPVNLECRVLSVQTVGDHDLILGQVVAEHVDEDKLDPAGQPDPQRLEMLIYAFGQYWSAGRPLARHGFTRARQGGGG